MTTSHLNQGAINAAIAHCQAKSAWQAVQERYRKGEISRDQRKQESEPINVQWDASWEAWIAATTAQGGE